MIPTEPGLVREFVKAIHALGGFEAWEIPGSPNYYVTDSGRVFSYYRARVRPLIGSKSGYGYRVISCGAGGPRYYIHRLVAQLFLPPPQPEQWLVRHLDGDIYNNDSANLAWGTSQDNADDSVALGRAAGGARNGNAKLTWPVADEIRRLVAGGLSQRDAARLHGISPMSVHRLVTGNSWKERYRQ